MIDGDAPGDRTTWRWAGFLNEVALLLFAALAAAAVIRAAGIRGDDPHGPGECPGGSHRVEP